VLFGAATKKCGLFGCVGGAKRAAATVERS